MARPYQPPDTLSKDDIRTLGDVRREIWSNALYGMGYGSGSGLVLHTGAQWMRRFGLFQKMKLSRNTLMLSILGGGSLGSFLFALVTGKGEVHKLHPVFQVGAKPTGDLDYQRTIQQAQGREARPEEVDVEQLRRLRFVRRQSLMNSFEKGHGLSDAHGGHWVHDDSRESQ